MTVGVLVLHNPCTAPPCPSPNRQCRGGHPYSPDSRTTPNQRHSAGGMMRLRSRFRICLPSPCCCALQADTWQHGKTSSRLLPRAGAPPHNITHMSRTVQLQGLTAPSPAPVTARPVACQRQPLHKADIPHSLCPRLRHFQRVPWNRQLAPTDSSDSAIEFDDYISTRTCNYKQGRALQGWVGGRIGRRAAGCFAARTANPICPVRRHSKST